MTLQVDCTKLGIRDPRVRVSIDWEVDGCSGTTTTQAWRIQHEVEQLKQAGYSIIGVRRALGE